MANILAIDTTTDRLLVCAQINGAFSQKISDNALKKHNGLLLVYIDEVLAELNATLSDIDCFACVVGPGSFTGIRIGIATIKAFCMALGKKAVAIDSLSLIAFSHSGNFATAIDARNNNFYAGMFSGDYKNALWLKSVTKDELLSYNVKVIYQSLPVNAQHLLAIAQHKWENSDFDNTLSPVYLKKSQAERMKDGD